MSVILSLAAGLGVYCGMTEADPRLRAVLFAVATVNALLAIVQSNAESK